MDPAAPLWMQARAVAATLGSNGTKTTLGYYVSDQFWRFRELSVAYQLPARLLSFVRGQSGSTLVFGARNLHLWTKFTGLDPESNYGVANPGNNNAEGQNEFNTAPLPTYFTFRLNLKY